MKHALLTWLLTFSSFLLAEGQTYCKKPWYLNVESDKLIISFKENVNLIAKDSIVKSLGLTILYDLPAPKVTIVKTNGTERLSNCMINLNNHPYVNFANYLLKTVDNSTYALLENIYVKIPKNVSLEELVPAIEKLKLRAEQIPGLERTYILKPSANFPGGTLNRLMVLKKLPFEYVEPDALFNPIICTNDPFLNRQWAIHNDSTTIISGNPDNLTDADMDVDSAWTITTGDPNIKIAVIDAGVDTLHPDLNDNLLTGFDATGQGSKGYPNMDKSQNAHGTACSGIIAAEGDNNEGIAGVAYSCKIVPIRMFYYIDTSLNGIPLPNTPWSTTTWMANALSYAIDSAQVDVISNSWAVPDLLIPYTGGDTGLVNDIIRKGASEGRNGKGIAMFFSSGNFDPAQPFIAPRPLWPSRLPEVIAVNATSMCDEAKSVNSCDGEQWMGHMGDSLDISAPGVKVATCDISGNKGYSSGDYTFTFNGTSAACPNAAGVMALIYSIRPDLDLEGAKSVLFQSAEKVGGYDYYQARQYGNWSDSLGYGRVNAYKALLMAQNYTAIDNMGWASFTCFPNPNFQGNVGIRFTSPIAGSIAWSLISFDGRTLYDQTFDAMVGVNTFQVNPGVPLASGIYLVKLTAFQQTFTQRIIIQ
ncbi:MAG: S8 family peptidase [Chitinophagales bacterium]|nr:S8 family peptidase [Chitinophagales bacterium]